jgi:hypothetical protein
MSDLVEVTLKLDNTVYLISLEDAIIAKQKGLLVIPTNDGAALTVEDVFGADYESSV